MNVLLFLNYKRECEREYEFQLRNFEAEIKYRLEDIFRAGIDLTSYQYQTIVDSIMEMNRGLFSKYFEILNVVLDTNFWAQEEITVTAYINDKFKKRSLKIRLTTSLIVLENMKRGGI